MEKLECIEYDFINEHGEWQTNTVYELIEWNETENEKKEEE